MALSITDRETEQMARELARRTGESVALATKRALAERLRRTEDKASRQRLFEELEEIRERLNRLPRIDERSAEEILGYDERGLPG